MKAANMGGFVSILSAAYFILFGSQRVNPWGIVQRHILKSVPTVPPVYMPSINDNLEKGYLSLSQTFHNNGPQHTSELPLPVFNSQVTEDYIAQGGLLTNVPISPHVDFFSIHTVTLS
ncbi:hypothetical protein RhiirA4_272639 [Rhizophagus irregularis]|uniref:Uncharacterized protein n=1 Tax=Rhizophagus irregularis TaxID=588596 RepID=A0A2I1GW52_9GLOM|nr:hypothetical protein RhiirA4_272639 [Rhizophagus irregularis]